MPPDADGERPDRLLRARPAEASRYCVVISVRCPAEPVFVVIDLTGMISPVSQRRMPWPRYL
jgi:hypothetical protein